jgi:beta-lactam-binding protein with PASTA domain
MNHDNVTLTKYLQKKLKLSDETPPNFIKRKHPRKGEKKKQGARTEVHVSKQPR